MYSNLTQNNLLLTYSKISKNVLDNSLKEVEFVRERVHFLLHPVVEKTAARFSHLIFTEYTFYDV